MPRLKECRCWVILHDVIWYFGTSNCFSRHFQQFVQGCASICGDVATQEKDEKVRVNMEMENEMKPRQQLK